MSLLTLEPFGFDATINPDAILATERLDGNTRIVFCGTDVTTRGQSDYLFPGGVVVQPDPEVRVRLDRLAELVEVGGLVVLILDGGQRIKLEAGDAEAIRTQWAEVLRAVGS